MRPNAAYRQSHDDAESDELAECVHEGLLSPWGRAVDDTKTSSGTGTKCS